jgi:DtxR family Mn-dependent transcriptional regulator
MNRMYEETLEAVWMCEERDKHRIDEMRETCHVQVDDAVLEGMEREGLVALDDTLVYMSGKGRKIAESLIRRKRLGEVLLESVLDIKGEKADRIVCELEHEIIPEVEESICILLGHPTECPHGNRIPPGSCCLQKKRDIERKVDSIANLRIGQPIKIAYIKPSSHNGLHKLLNLGIKPGTVIEIHQKRPTFIIRLENSEIAMDEEIARAIYGWGTGREGEIHREVAARDISIWKRPFQIQPGGREGSGDAGKGGQGWGAGFRRRKRGGDRRS